MVFVKTCFMILLHSLLWTISTANSDCCCCYNDLKRVHTDVSWTPRLSNLVTRVILVMILLDIVVYTLRKLHEKSLIKDEEHKQKSMLLSSEHPCRHFSLAKIQLATKNFDPEMIIGKGGFGKVYKGFIDDGGTTVAIKRLDCISRQGASEFWTEVKMLSKVQHGHLVSLIGYCNEFDEMMVVYEYISGGDLAKRLHKVNGKSIRTPLSWVERLKICIGAARALDYLHTGTGVNNRIIHRDVKSSNILLDENMAAKVSDLGVSKTGPVDQPCTHVSTEVKGSFGYFDPNYFMTCRLTRKSDVYSFGVVLLEVLCGRPAVDPSLGDDELGLVGWAQRNIIEGTLNDIIDLNMKVLTPCLRVKIQIMPDCLKTFVEIAVKCLQTRSKDRPTMSEVVVALEAALALQERGDYLVCSRYDKGKQISSSSYSKSGKIITLSRMLRNMLPAKTRVRPDVKDGSSLGRKKKQHRWLLSSKLSHKDIPSESGASFQEVEVQDSSLKKFSLERLKIVARNFSDDVVVGEGAFGKVFKGWVEPETYIPSKVGSGIAVAIKKLDLDGYQGIEEWQTEVKLLSRLSHPNLIRLLGYCSEDKELLLVYEFMEKGDLDSNILKRSYGPSLPWSVRVKIMIGTAQAIAYLYTEENQIIYRDLKTSNILLDQDFNAKIADFGLAMRGPINSDTHLSTQVVGTYGYAAPEYIATGYLNGKNDIYAFGVVLLETLTGLRVFDKTRPKNEQNLVEWMRPMLPNKKMVKNIVDPILGADYPPKAAYKCARLILKCTQPEPRDRPPIEQVLQSLEQISSVIIII